MQELDRRDLARATGGGVLATASKWGGRALWGVTIGSAGYDSVTAGQAEYQKSQSVGRSVVAGGRTAVRELAGPAAYAAADYVGLINPYTLGAMAFAKVMEPTPAY